MVKDNRMVLLTESTAGTSGPLRGSPSDTLSRLRVRVEEEIAQDGMSEHRKRVKGRGLVNRRVSLHAASLPFGAPPRSAQSSHSPSCWDPVFALPVTLRSLMTEFRDYRLKSFRRMVFVDLGAYVTT